ncbi:zf-CSL-domain-containing protein [Anaeromyces robustus]|uniref:Diphthamide biosynthesis protein 3 n=1 Tax=Anaeromyces robustus TaxID=1754192 RepID=A0A1Y1XPW4_9FUNG|nr:zf-CSL-domain-containing protein [Anaeromyces robustus]|eukprot:ORX87556.1 zf-CSL-domain-containing protein [Anaeromyces robustus]
MDTPYDEIEIEDMTFDEKRQVYIYPCPCGDKFEITVEQLKNGEDIAQCPSCSLIIKIIYDPNDFQDEEVEEEVDN